MSSLSLIFAAIELVAPNPDATIPLLTESQRAVLPLESRVERDAALNKLEHKSEGWRQHQPVVMTWRATAGEKGPWELKIGTKSDLSDARAWLIAAGKYDPAKGYTVPYFNPEIATTYYWQVAGDILCEKQGHRRVCGCKDRKPPTLSAIHSFKTEDLAPRWIEIEGRVKNFRDFGGRVGMNGKRVRQGMIYRSQGLNDNSIDGLTKGSNRLTVCDVEYLTETLGIKTDLDLRGDGETAKMTVSPLGKDVRYIQRGSHAYAGIFKDPGEKVMAANFRVFLDEKNYPILFHCIAGADRTGALGYVMNGVLGVARREIETDWESTFYPRIPHTDKNGALVWNSEEHFNAGFSKYGKEGDSWNRRIELYLLDCGITQDEIEKFRSIMLK